MNKNIKLELTDKQVEVVEIALNEMFNSDSWTWNIKEYSDDDVDTISNRAEYILKIISRLRVKPEYIGYL